ncbi:MFS transporter [Embleya scabrispora]|uniref:MFS transporter n=1 Tax=Embleya scabrispora TaxID=159449 RepID=UPI00036E8D25|nr:MFS transporter [Embleya scabrispora]MYS83613.1 MFS transporter [Streptomyces sp. SID5474]
MRNPYRDIFTAPGAKGFSAAGFIARMPISMTGIGIVTMLSELRGEYGLAGAVAATFALATALIAPQISRIVDRYGQGRVLVPATAVSVLAMGVLLLCARYDAPDWTLFACAVPAGCMPSMGAMVRSRWLVLYRGSPHLHTAFSFESVVDELCFILGPIIAVQLSVAAFPEAGPLAAIVFFTVGVLLFIVQRGTEPPPHPRVAGKTTSVMRIRGLQVLVVTLIAIGAIFGTVDVVTIAFAEEHGQRGSASFVLATYAAGSCVAGIAFGAFRFATPLPRMLLISIGCTAVTIPPLLLAGNLPVLAATVFVAGMSISPTMILTISLVERLVPPARLTEGMTWTTTGIGIGVAAGSSLSGMVVDHFGARAGFGVAAGAALLAASVALGGYRVLRRTAPRATTVAHSGSLARATPVREGEPH